MEDIVALYKRTHARSAKLHEEAVKYFSPDGCTHSLRMFDPFRPYITHGKGSHKWDVDGNEYIDYAMGHGCLILGHGHPAIVKAVKEQMDKGTHFAGNHELEIEWAKLIQEMIPMAERIEFFSSGSEANMMAVRLARAFTGRKKILKFDEHWHGWGDALQPPKTPGVPDEIAATVIPANDLDLVERELAKGEYAALITEGGGGHMGGMVPLDKDFARALPGLTRKYGTVWVIDEVVTGFRDSPGGWQATVGVTPDLTTLGKAVGGGLGIGVVIGRADILDLCSSRTPSERRIRHLGTWNANPLTCAAGVAACKLLKTGEVQKKINDLGAYFRKSGNRLLKERGYSARFYGPTKSIVNLYVGPIDFEPSDDQMPPTKDTHKIMDPAVMPLRQRLTLYLLQLGVDTYQARYCALSIAHTREDIDQTVKAFINAIESAIADGTFEKYGKESKYSSLVAR